MRNDAVARAAVLERSIMKLMTLFLSLSLLLGAASALAQPVADDIGKPFATVWRIKGEVSVGSPAGPSRKLTEGSVVAVGEEVSASAAGEAVLKTGDGGLVAVRPNTRFVAESFAAEGKSSDRQVLRLITGAVRVVSGWIGQLNRGGHKLVTPTATIGIRGTDHETYVLPRELATAAYQSGTYDKVTRGGTVLETSGGSLDIDPGKVGFVRDPSPVRTRALMTLLMPVLLDRVPGFFVAGSFDQEVERYSREADSESRWALAKRNPEARIPEPATGDGRAAKTPAAGSAAPPPAELPRPTGCEAKAIAAYWLSHFDGAIQRKDVKTILAMLAPDVTALARVRSGNELIVIEFDREELVKSTLASVSSVKDYQYRRTTLEASLADGETVDTCGRLTLRSIAIEQGTMNGKPYRIEAQEDYVLERRGDEWLATRAETTQR